MLKTPKGAPTEKEILEFNLRLARRGTLDLLDEIKDARGLGTDVLTARPAGGTESIGALWCRIVATEFDVVNRLHKVVKKPLLPKSEFWANFLNESYPAENIPAGEAIFTAMEDARGHLIDVLRSSSNAIMDTVLTPAPQGPEGTARFYFIFLAQHEAAIAAQIKLLHRLLS